MFNRIMVALDGSVAAEQGLHAASDLARRLGSDLHLVHVLDVLSRPVYTSHMSPYEYWNGGALEAAGKYLRVTAERMAAGHALSVSQSLLQGDIVTELEKELRRVDADLMIMTTHGIGGGGQEWIGSVADRLIRRSIGPVLLLRPHAPQSFPYRRILVALDGSATAEQILEPAARLATVCDAHLTLLTVARPPFSPVSVLTGMTGPIRDGMVPDTAAADDTGYLESVTASIEEYSLNVDAQVLVTDDATASAILHHATVTQTDCIALATRGRGRIARSLLGSVADKVIRHARCAVLILSPDDS